MTTQAHLGQQAIDKRDYQEAVTQYTAALKTSQSPLWLINRSTAYQRLGKHELAIADADNAVVVAVQRSRREQIATAQFRRAVAFHALKQFGNARMCLIWCRKYNEKEKALGIWQAKVTSDYEAAEKEDKKELLEITVKEIPDPVKEVGSADKYEKTEKKPVAATNTASAPALSQTPKEKIRHEWLQSNSKVTITIFAKGVPKDKAEVNIQKNSLEVRFPSGESGTYDFTLDPLYSNIDPASSDFRVTPYKIEINLHKKKEGLKWATLEGDAQLEEEAKPVRETKIGEPPKDVVEEKEEIEKAPVYPTSSRKGPKDWDKLASDALKAEKAKGGEKDAGLGDDDDDEADPMNGFFKKLYKDADADTRRAMMKSYQESNGTALSTNWADVSKGPVETHPPEGLVAKKWGE